MGLSQKNVVKLVKDTLMPAFMAERKRLDRIDKWYRWDHDNPHSPRHATKEYKELASRSQTSWLGLVVTSVAQGLYVDGYRSATEKDNARPWEWWQVNGMDGRQVALHRAALAYGLAYTTVMPGVDDFGEKIPVIRAHSPRNMIAFYAEPAHDDWPMYALRAEPAKVSGSIGWALRVYDDTSVYYLNCDAGGTSITYIETREHNLGLCPIVRYANMLDLEGRSPGEVEQFIPVAARIDQTVFDRLVVQRFASWKVRTIAGMALPETIEVTGETPETARMRLKAEDILVAEDHETKFGTLDETPLDGFIKAAEADVKTLAAVTQTPAHEMLGTLANLSAEALAAARASRTGKVEERQHPFGESHEQTLRASAWVMGEMDAAKDRSAQVRWRDTEIRSLAQAADALGKIAKMLSVPVEVLWEKIPGWTDQDVERAIAIAKEGDSLSELAAVLDKQTA